MNTSILDVLREVWNTGIDLPTLPPSENYPIPASHRHYPQQGCTDSVETGSGHTENNRLDSKRLLLRKTIEIADKFKDEPNLYMVYQLDFRGRAYCVPNYLNPQGTDFAKSLLVFAEGRIDEVVLATLPSTELTALGLTRYPCRPD